MCDHWMPTITLPITLEQFRQLPRHPAFKYEYVDGKAILTPYARHYHAMLDLSPRDAPADEEIRLRAVRPGDWTELVPVFAGTFRTIQPYGSLDEPTRLIAAEEALNRTLTGGDGPWIEKASFVVEAEGKPVGGIFITLLPDRDPTDWESYRWSSPPAPDAIAKCEGRPHLTWIFVDPLHAGYGTGTLLLASAVNALHQMGFKELLTTFMLGNTSSMLWHWRNGFRLLPYPASRRLKKHRS